jgi:hypothetical protein
VLAAAAESFGLTGLGIGARAGVIANYDNPELSFEEAKSIDVDQLSMIGGHARISSLPVFTYEVVAEYSWHSEEFPVAGTDISVKVRDFMLGANLKYVFKIPGFAPYVGGGVATHQMTYEFDPSLGSVLNGANVIIPDDGPRFGIHGLAGLKLGLPASPLEFFVEGRIGRISGEDESANYSAVYGGVTLKLL